MFYDFWNYLFNVFKSLRGDFGMFLLVSVIIGLLFVSLTKLARFNYK